MFLISHSTKILILLCLMVTVGRFALDSYLPSLPDINHYFHTTSNIAQLTLTVFLVGFSVSQLFYGALSDYYGRRKVILSGFVIFLLGALLCAVSTSLEMLLLARFITGVGGGVSSSLKRAVAADTFKDFSLAKASAMQSNAILLTILFAPVVGSYIEMLYGWRMNFLIAFLYGFIIFILLYRYLPDTRAFTSKPQSLRFKNIIRNYSTILAFRPFIANVTYSTCAFSGMVIFSQLSAFLLIDTLNISTTTYGWLITLIAVSYLTAGIIVNQLGKYMGMKNLILLGIGFLFLSGFLLVSELELQIFNTISVILPALIYVLGARIILPNAMARSISPFPEIAGYASALISILQTTGAALSSYLICKFYASNLTALTIAYLVLPTIALFALLMLEKSEQVAINS